MKLLKSNHTNIMSWKYSVQDRMKMTKYGMPLSVRSFIAGYLTKDIENYGLLKITPKGKEFMKKPVSFKITEDNEFEEEVEEVPINKGGASCAVDPVLYSMMKYLRKKLSKRLEVPPFVIFQDPSLEAMATTYPVTIEELQNIPGVGAEKQNHTEKNS